MRVLVVENYPKTGLGQLGTALTEAAAQTEAVRAYAGEQLPETHQGFDAMVLLGGGQSALADAEHPYLPHEAALARAFGEAGKAVLGICLGAQLIARGYGAENILGRPLEFGWHTVRATEAGRNDPVVSVMGAETPIFHWHSDTFNLPDGAVRLAESERTANQAFRLGRAVYATQFHFEADTGLVADWTRDFAHEIAPFTPDWFDRHGQESARHGPAADAAGLALARAWVGLIG